MHSKELALELCKTDGGSQGVTTLEAAYFYCRRAALGHYENFPVGSALLPAAKRNYVFAIYAFARLADDIADTGELTTPQKLDALSQLESALISCRNFDSLSNPIFKALAHTRKELSLPDEPFLKLLAAFKSDADFRQPREWSDVFAYCENSANPVGELILRTFGLYNGRTAPLSDAICTGLQLANFWQDFSVDLYLPQPRVYLPEITLKKNNLSNSDLYDLKYFSNFSESLKEALSITYELFERGAPLTKALKPFRLRLEIAATLAGGRAILDKVRELDYRVLATRPTLSKRDLFKLIIRSIFFY